MVNYLQLGNSLFDLLNLHLAEALDLKKRLACSSVDRLNRVSKPFRSRREAKESPTATV